MIFVGNDVVHITHPSNLSRTLTSRFLNKVCTPKEQRFVLEADSPVQSMWHLWSMKESAFKVLMKMKEASYFLPNQIEIQSPIAGIQEISEVTFKAKTIFSKMESGWITSVASNDLSGLERVIVQTQQSGCEDESIGVRELLFELLDGLNLPKEKLAVNKDDLGIPYLYQNRKRTPIDISLSHDHGVLSAAFLN
jgi:phosphopantetheine--protein transferase-like protein